MSGPRVIVVGGGLAGLAATTRIVESGLQVDLFSLVPVKRSHSVCAQVASTRATKWPGNRGTRKTNTAMAPSTGATSWPQAPVRTMTHWAPKIIDLLDRMGVPFNRTAEGRRDLRLFGGSLFKRTHFGASTGQQLLYA